jgi:hypothetical protein
VGSQDKDESNTYQWCDEGEDIIVTRCTETWGGESMAAA